MSIHVNDYVKVEGEAYTVPPQASRESMALAMFEQDNPDNHVLIKQRERFRRSAKGVVAQSFIGKVMAIREEVVVLERATTGTIEHAHIDSCTKITICRSCFAREAVYRGVCKKAKCREKMA